MVASLADMDEVKYEQSSRSMTCPDVWVNEKFSLTGVNVMKCKMVRDETREEGMKYVTKL